MTLKERWFRVLFGALVAYVGGRVGGRIMYFGLHPKSTAGEKLGMPDRTLSPSAGVPHGFVGADPFECRLCLCTPEHPIHHVDEV